MAAGLRERKKLRTHQLIFEAAARLFEARGFDGVTISEVAHEADVSEMTVYKHFPTKEDLVFSGLIAFEERLVDAVRERAPGESPLDACRRLLLDSSRLESDAVAELIRKGAVLMRGSAALQTRELQVMNAYTEQLAELLAEETAAAPDDVEPRSVAQALIGTHRALVLHIRHQVLAGRHGPQLAAGARAQAAHAFARLDRGLAEFAVRPLAVS